MACTLQRLASSAHPTASLRSETWQGDAYVVLPVVALVEGVLEAMNAPHPEFVPAEEFVRIASSFNGRPVFYGHPMRHGTPVSGNHPDVIAGEAIGAIFNAGVKDNKLVMEAWVHRNRVATLAPDLLSRLDAKDWPEVSVGVLCDTESSWGRHDGVTYQGVWRNLVSDHLAILPAGHRGACSREMGCGVRAAHARPADPPSLLDALRAPADEATTRYLAHVARPTPVAATPTRVAANPRATLETVETANVWATLTERP
jgi:hypothetical protein